MPIKFEGFDQISHARSVNKREKKRRIMEEAASLNHKTHNQNKISAWDWVSVSFLLRLDMKDEMKVASTFGTFESRVKPEPRSEIPWPVKIQQLSRQFQSKKM